MWCNVFTIKFCRIVIIVTKSHAEYGHRTEKAVRRSALPAHKAPARTVADPACGRARAVAELHQTDPAQSAAGPRADLAAARRALRPRLARACRRRREPVLRRAQRDFQRPSVPPDRLAQAGA